MPVALPDRLWTVWSDATYDNGKRNVGPIFETFDQDEAHKIKDQQEKYLANQQGVVSSVVVVYGLPMPSVTTGVRAQNRVKEFVVTADELRRLSEGFDTLQAVVSKFLLGGKS